MTTPSESLQSRLQPYLARRLNAPVSITRFTALIGGACQDNYAVDLYVGDDPTPGEYVLRTDKGRALALSLSREAEYHVIESAYRAGVKTPKPFLLEPSPEVLGHPFYLMARIAGTAIARKVLSDPGLASVRAKLSVELAEQLARIHTITPEHDGPPLPVPKQSPVQSALEQARASLDGLSEPLPALELGLRWLQANAPPKSRVTLVHGDYRTGNFMVTPDGLSGVLDWEFAHYGDPLEDVAWIGIRDWRFGRLEQPVGGFAYREPFYRAYEAASGREVNAAYVHYWEVFGNFNWAGGAAQQAERHLSGADRSIELASIGRRVPEMAYEMLRLIERGPIPRA